MTVTKVELLAYIVFFGLFSLCSSINVTQCHDIDKPIENLSEKVKIGNCKRPPCRLRKDSIIPIELKLKPEQDVEKLVNTIQAYIVGVPFPFPGVDQTDACQYIYSSDGKNKESCPLKAGQDYLYRNAIEVLQIYPRVKTVVHWGLTKSDGKDLICFEVPARITN